MSEALDEFEFFFTDTTILESNGGYEEVQKLMEEDIGGHDWVLITNLTVFNKQLGSQGEFELHMFKGGKVVIYDYVPSIGDLLYNPDLSALTMWCLSTGWDVPEPFPDLVELDREFWKHFWETSIIKSELLDSRYGTDY